MAFKFNPISTHTLYKDEAQWSQWIWQMQNRLETQTEYAKVFDLSEAERRGFEVSQNVFKISTTPYYASLTALVGEPLRRIIMPHDLEIQKGAQAMLDPLGENKNSPHPRIVHRYSDRVLFLVTDICSVYCRFCTRKRFTGLDQGFLNSKEYSESLDYIKSHPGIREVILSGGDPLTLSDSILDRVLRDIRSIDHVEIIRIGSRMPVVCPMRIDNKLAGILREYAPVFVMTHFNHPKELTAESALALSTLIDRGVPVFNQSVLLNGVNNHVNIIQALNRRLLYLRVKPYYLFQCDPSEGTDHLRTSIDDSEEIIRQMWGHLSGLAMANLSVDIPDGGGKTTLVPNFTKFVSPEFREYEGWDGIKSNYVNPMGPNLLPADYNEYEEEWACLKNSKS